MVTHIGLVAVKTHFLLSESLRRLIAREMARIHAIHAHNGCIPKPDLWITMRKYFSIVATEFTDQASNIRWVLVGFLYSFVKTHLCSHLRTKISVVVCCLVGMNIERIWLFKLFCILSWWQSCLMPTTVPGGSDSHTQPHTHTDTLLHVGKHRVYLNTVIHKVSLLIKGGTVSSNS